MVDPVEELTFRARVADFLFGLNFPASHAQIIQRARHNNTASQIMEALAALPDRQYAHLADVQATVAYHSPRLWDSEGFPAEAHEHDRRETERIRRNIQRAHR
jgi:hypothetical protein